VLRAWNLSTSCRLRFLAVTSRGPIPPVSELEKNAQQRLAGGLPCCFLQGECECRPLVLRPLHAHHDHAFVAHSGCVGVRRLVGDGLRPFGDLLALRGRADDSTQ
jgi:hypothetical protein